MLIYSKKPENQVGSQTSNPQKKKSPKLREPPGRSYKHPKQNSGSLKLSQDMKRKRKTEVGDACSLPNTFEARLIFSLVKE